MQKTAEAVILAGGKGTRLAPLTEDTPKPLLRVMGKSVLECVFEKLRQCGIRKARVTTMYLPWQIESFGNDCNGLEIEYVREKRPLGTAGAVRNAFDGESDTVLVLSGDGIYDFDLKKALDFHYEKNADVTIVTYQTENPLEYGVVLSDKDGRIERFAEKPPWAKVVSGAVNTGIYIIKKEILERIPKDTEYDFGKQLFPLLLAGKSAMYAYEATGTWHDIGSLDEYFSANRSALDGKFSGFPNTGLTASELEERGIEAEMPVYVSPGAVFGKNVKLGAYTVIGDGAVIADGCDIACSVIGERTSLGMGCGIYGTLIGRNCVFGENCVSSEGCAIGGDVEIEDSVILPKYSVIHSGAHVSGSDFLAGRTGKRENVLIDDDGIRLTDKRQNPEYLVRIGSCAAQAVRKNKSGGNSRIGVMTDGNPALERFKNALLCGVQSQGIRSCDFGGGFEALARYAAMRFVTDIVLYVSYDKEGLASVKCFDGTGLDAGAEFEREFTNLFYSAGEYTLPDRFYTTDRFENLWTLYYSELIKSTRTLTKENGLQGFRCAVSDKDEIRAYGPLYTALYAICELKGTVCGLELEKPNGEKPTHHQDGIEVPTFRLDDQGVDASVSYGQTFMDSYHMGAVLIENMQTDVSGGKLYLSSDMPEVYRTLAEKKNISMVEYASCSHINANLSGDDMLRQLWLNDGVYKILHMAALLHTQNTTLDVLESRLPAFAYLDSRFEGNPHRAGVMQSLAKMSAKTGGKQYAEDDREGVRLVLAGGSVTVIPGKASGFRIISEAVSTEAAEELCSKAETYLR